MGSDDGADDERPVHRVWVDAFEIAPTQVTNREYAAFRDETQFDHPDQPVVGVSWFDAVEYCRVVGPLQAFRLPTEAEWECAARGGVEGKRYPWGDAPQSRPDYDRPMPVARGMPNAFGLYDMCENVHEWCSDWYDAELLRASHRSAIRAVPKTDRGARRAAARGGIRSRSAAAPRARASRPNSGTRTMDSEWRPIRSRATRRATESAARLAARRAAVHTESS